MKHLLSFIVASFLSANAFGFGLFNNIVNNLSSGGHLCGKVSPEHYQSFLSRLDLPESEIHRSTKGTLPQRNFETLVYRQSLELFKNKTSCMRDYTEAIVASDDAIDEIRQTMAVVWLNKKKASLILHECNVIMNEIALMANQHVGSMQPQSRDAYSIQNLVRRNPNIKESYYPICMDNKKVTALRSLVALADRSLPVFSSRELLNIMEKQRGALISKSSQRPITDDELRKLDLVNDRSVIRFDRTKKDLLNREISNYLNTKIAERLKFARNIKDNRFQKAIFQELYEDGSVDEFFLRAEIGSTVLKQDKDLNRMVSCMRADYDTSLIGTSLDFIAVFALTRAGLGRVSSLRGLPNVMKDAMAASVAGSPAILKACFNKNRITDHFSGFSKNHTVALHKTHLPQGLDVDIYNLESVPLESIPSCAEKQYDHIFLDQSLASSCIEEAVYNTLPLSMGLSYAMGQMVLEQ